MKTIRIKSPSGFTLIELIAVIAIVAMLASLALPRFVDVESNAGKRILASAVTELNGRESLTWCKIRLTKTGWVDDPGVFSQMDTNLGVDYKWAPKAKIDGGKLHYRDHMIELTREPSTLERTGRWVITHASD